MLTEIAIGDGYGRPFEFNTTEFIEQNNDPGKGYAHREGETVDGIGKYTDDTQMTIAIAQHMLSDRFCASSIHYANRFLISYKRDPRGGYSKRLKNALEGSEKALGFLEIINPAGMSSNGSVMRTIPLGLLPDPKQIMSHCMAHTIATHHHLDAINATIAVALTAHYIYHDIDINFQVWLEDHMGVEASRIMRSYVTTPSDGVPCDAFITASWCINIAMGYLTVADYVSALKFSVSLGGDVDSIAAIAMGLMSLKGEPFNQNHILYRNLENGDYGRDYLLYLDSLLFAKYPKNEKLQPQLEENK